MEVICGPIYDNDYETWRRKYNKKLQREMEMASVVSFIRRQRIQWLGLSSGVVRKISIK